MTNEIMNNKFLEKLNELAELYLYEIIPLVQMTEVLKEKFSPQVLSEIRNACTHLVRCWKLLNLDSSKEVDKDYVIQLKSKSKYDGIDDVEKIKEKEFSDNLRKAENHCHRAVLDLSKYLCSTVSIYYLGYRTNHLQKIIDHQGWMLIVDVRTF